MPKAQPFNIEDGYRDILNKIIIDYYGANFTNE